jgi:hypothetical protein
VGVYSSMQTLDLSREGQITDRFTKAIEQLGALDRTMDQTGNPRPKLSVRLGGIYALERIARDSEKDEWPILEILTGYVREQSLGRTESTGFEGHYTYIAVPIVRVDIRRPC